MNFKSIQLQRQDQVFNTNTIAFPVYKDNGDLEFVKLLQQTRNKEKSDEINSSVEIYLNPEETEMIGHYLLRNKGRAEI